VFDDNYVWLVRAGDHPEVAVVDPGDGAPVIAALERHRLRAAAVLVTHRHADHVGGVDAVADHASAPVYAPAEARLRRVDHVVDDGDRVALGATGLELDVVAVPGHTLGHVAFVTPGFAFVGDTLFAGGCGRVFEGTMSQMFASLERLAGLPPETEIYCGHEYTVANLEFALLVEPDNSAVQGRLRAARAAVADGRPTVPARLEEELATNPFLRCREPSVVRAAGRRAGREVAPGVDTFEVIRRWKDRA
jgi:hydroxyacylglutathione hydrolase